MGEVHVNGVRLYYEEHGQGEPILCIHGTSSSALVWRPAAIAELSRLGRLIVYDRRGCTRSERPDPYETSVVQHAEDASGLLQVLEAVPAVVIGRSYGGETAVELALRHPAQVRALVLLEAALLTLDREATQWAEERPGSDSEPLAGRSEALGQPLIRVEILADSEGLKVRLVIAPSILTQVYARDGLGLFDRSTANIAVRKGRERAVVPRRR